MLARAGESISAAVQSPQRNLCRSYPCIKRCGRAGRYGCLLTAVSLRASRDLGGKSAHDSGRGYCSHPEPQGANGCAAYFYASNEISGAVATVLLWTDMADVCQVGHVWSSRSCA